MRYTFISAILLLVSACNNAPNAQNVANDELAVDSAIDQVHALQMQVAMLSAEVAAMRAALPTADGGASAMPVHVPHLVAVDGTDLGPFAGYDVAWSTELNNGAGAYYEITNRSLILYSGPGCNGEARETGGGDDDWYDFKVASTGTIIRSNHDAAMFSAASYLDGECYDGARTVPASTFSDTGITARTYERQYLRVR